MARMMRTDPARYAVLIGNLLDAFGPDHILWCTDTPVIGPPRWQIEAFQGFTIPEAMIEQREFQPLTPEVKHKIFGRNAARIFGIDIVAARRGTEEAKNFAQAETPGVGGTRLHCRTISRLSADSGRSWNRDRAARFVESPGGLSPPGAPRSVREPLDSYGSRCSAVSMTELPVGEECWIDAA